MKSLTLSLPAPCRRHSRKLALALALAVAFPLAAQDAPDGQDEALQWARGISVEQMDQDWRALEAAADQHGGERAHGSAGYEAAARHVEEALRAEGIAVRREPFRFQNREGFNLVAEIPGSQGPGGPVIMLGAHLDSVAGSPGGDDNGSGASAVLAIARQAAARPLPATLRVEWWGAEEWGIVGSSAHVRALSADPGALRQVRAYLNADMIASPNFIYGIYDPDHPAAGGRPAAAQARDIHRALAGYFTVAGLPQVGISPVLSSDQLAFLRCGIATGGVASIPGIRDKTPEEQALFGGQAGARHSPNYHRPTDRVDAASKVAHEVLMRSLAYAVVRLAEAPPPAMPSTGCDTARAGQDWLRARSDGF